MRNKLLIEEKTKELIELTREFCDNFLDDEYKHLCEKLIRKMSRKHNVPFLRGRENIWAASIIHALGRINFLFDQHSKPHVSAAAISKHFKASKKYVSQKATKILDMLKIRHWDKEFSTSAVKEHDPFSNLMMINGIPIVKKNLPINIKDLLDIFQSENNITKEYRKYRFNSKTLIWKIIDFYLKDDVLLEAARMLGLTDGEQILVNNVLEEHALLDFTIFDYKINGKSFIEQYQEEVNKNEKKMLENLLSFQTSLFKVKNVFIREHALILDDLLNDQNDLKLIDIGLSQTTKPEMLLFTRLLPFKQFKITSGVNFAFQKTLKEELVNEYASLNKIIEHNDLAIKRFITFFQFYKMYGIEVIPFSFTY
jgi:hypothetical protein